jgi:hypothetical protein
MSEETSVNIKAGASHLTRKEILSIVIHAFIGWALCTAAMVIPMQLTTIETALIIHAIGAPIIFGFVSLSYFKNYNFTTPVMTGLIFVGFVIFMDLFLVAMIVMRSYEMFASLLGTWIPFTLIITSTFVVGTLINRKSME